MTQHLLPANSTPLERVVSGTLDRDEALAPGADAVAGQKFRRPLTDGWGTWIVDELGLGPVSGYHATAELTIDEGVAWQRLRGTPAALDMAFGWICYAAIALEDEHPRRRKWHRYQVGMGALPATEVPQLVDADYLAALSDPARAIFWRGFHGYDVRALEHGDGTWGDTLWGDDSGVRLPGGVTVWSHGEDHAVAISLTADQRGALAAEVVAAGADTGWDAVPWTTPGLAWSGVTEPKLYKAFLLVGTPAFLGFYDADDQPIGYRRCFGAADVTADHPPIADTAYVAFRARTDFGEGYGSEAAKVALLFHSRPADAATPGRLWLEAGEIAFDPAYDAEHLTTAFAALPLTFRRTVREHVTVTIEV